METLQLSKDLIGKKLKSFSFTVEKGKIREFCLAIGETNPIFFDELEAKKAGFEGIPIPPTFQTCFQFWGYPEIFEDMRKIGIDTNRLLHMKEEYTYIKPIYAGMIINSESEIIDVKTGKMEVVTFRTTYKNEKQEPCIIAEMGIILRPKE